MAIGGNDRVTNTYRRRRGEGKSGYWTREYNSLLDGTSGGETYRDRNGCLPCLSWGFQPVHLRGADWMPVGLKTSREYWGRGTVGSPQCGTRPCIQPLRVASHCMGPIYPTYRVSNADSLRHSAYQLKSKRSAEIHKIPFFTAKQIVLVSSLDSIPDLICSYLYMRDTF